VLQEGEDLVAMMVEVLGEALVGIVRSPPGEESPKTTLEVAARDQKSMRRDLPRVSTISKRQGILQKDLDLTGKANRTSDGNFQKFVAAAEEVRQALLVESGREIVVRRPAIVTDDPRVLCAEDFLPNLASPTVSNEVDSCGLGHKRPKPAPDAPHAPACLVGIHRRALANDEKQLLVSILAPLGDTKYYLSRSTSRVGVPPRPLPVA
jgi:hypothetical protein